MEIPLEQEQLLNQTITHLEKIMLTLDPKAGIENHKYYLAGVIDCLYDNDKISNEIREILYQNFCF